uniref:ADP ribosylation factor like GTPase 13A n=1 Tax=Strigops habroptila TaxID=2489341 RepID=A0A672VAL5_STRHB
MGRVHCLGAPGPAVVTGPQRSIAFPWDAHIPLSLPRKVTLLVLGLDNAGKTSIIMDLDRVLPSEVLPVAQPGQTHLRVDRFEVTLLDLPGGPRSRSAWRSHYSAAHGLLFVLDSSDLARMEEARKVLSRVLSHPDVSGKPLLLLANKQDTASALLPCELIERLSLERLVNENRSPCRIVSAGLPRSRLPAPRCPSGLTVPHLRRSLVPPSGAPPPARPAIRCRGCAGSSAPSPPPRHRRPPPLRRPAPARGQPAAARPPAGGCGGPGVPVPVSRPHPSSCSCSSRDPPLQAEDAPDGAGTTGEYRPLRPVPRLLPVVSAPPGWDGMRWDGMGWDEMGWGGVG